MECVDFNTESGHTRAEDTVQVLYYTTVNSWLVTKDNRSICISMPTKRSYKIVAAMTTIPQIIPPLADSSFTRPVMADNYRQEAAQHFSSKWVAEFEAAEEKKAREKN